MSFSLGNVVKLTEKTTELLGRCKYNFEKKDLHAYIAKFVPLTPSYGKTYDLNTLCPWDFYPEFFKTPHLLTAEPVQTKRHCCLSFDVFYAYRFSQAPKRGE